MKNDLFASAPLSVSGRVRSVSADIGIVLAVLTLAVFSVLFFTDITFSAAATLQFSLSVLLLLFASCMMYAALCEVGTDKGMREDGYQKAETAFSAAKESAKALGKTEDIAAFCNEISERETTRLRKEVLSAYLLPTDAYAELFAKDRKNMSKNERLALRHLRHMGSVHITPALLFGAPDTSRYAVPFAKTPSKIKRRRTAFFLLSTVLTVFFSVSVVCQTAVSFSPSMFVSFLCKLFTLLCAGCKGFQAGYCLMVCDTVKYKGEQTMLLEEYIERQKSKTALKTKEM